MLYDLTTISLKPRTLPLVEQMIGEAYAALKPPELIGSFHTEVGTLNEIVQIWRFDDLETRRARLEDEDFTARWFAGTSAHVLAVRSEILRLVEMSPVLAPGAMGPYYELRQYHYPLGELDRLLSAWARAMPLRDALGSPVAAIWRAEAGILNSLTHLWPYPSIEEREAIRRKVRETGKWPPYKLDEADGRPGYDILHQSSKLMLPASFSPLQ